jgi:hypothetical protein
MIFQSFLRFPSSILTNDPDSELGKMMRLFETEMLELSEAFMSMIGLYDLTNKSQILLDYIGGLVREGRRNRTDQTYKRFLPIAIRKYLSRGDLGSIAEIGGLLIQGAGSLRSIEELAYNDSTAFLDGKDNWDGLWPLNGSASRPATFRITFAGSVDTLLVSEDFNTAIADIRAGGTKGEIVYQFQVGFQKFVKKFIRSSVLDGTWNLTGKSLLSQPIALPNVAKVAIGIGAEPGGALRPPADLDTALQNEILRKDAEVLSLSPNTWEVGVRLFPSEAGNQRINEIALYDSDNQLVALASFSGKTKDFYSLFNFSIIEETNVSQS